MLAGVEVQGLREYARALKKADVADAEVKDAMNQVGGILVREALRLVPVRTGRLAKTIKTTGGRNALTFQAGNNTTVRYAYTFHAIAAGDSKGGFTYRVTGYQRNNRGRSKGKTYVRGHTRKGYIPNRPFMFQAWERRQDDVLEAYVKAVTGLFRAVGRG